VIDWYWLIVVGYLAFVAGSAFHWWRLGIAQHKDIQERWLAVSPSATAQASQGGTSERAVDPRGGSRDLLGCGCADRESAAHRWAVICAVMSNRDNDEDGDG